MQRTSRTAAAAAIALVFLAGCTSGLRRPVVSAVATPDAQGVQRVTVHLHSFYFEPNRIVVHAGKPVELELHNSGHMIPHSFTIAAPGLTVNQGTWMRAARVRFTPTRPDSYTFFCHVDGHAKKGMTGTLVVEP